jgi:hypothetical protein
MVEIVKENGIVYAVTKDEKYGALDIRRIPIGTYEEEPIEIEKEPIKKGKKKKEQSK